MIAAPAVPSSDPSLVLRDIHQPPAPSWWPPAIGWWLLAAIVLVALGAWAWRAWRRRRRRRELARVFDAGIAEATTPVARIAAASMLLRRAARLRDPAAGALQGEAWLAFLDAGAPVALFAGDAGALLLDGGFRPEVDAGRADALVALVRRRFLQWMGAR